MTDLAEIENSWRDQQASADSYYCHLTTAGPGAYVSEIKSDWLNAINFEDFIRQQSQKYNLTDEEKENLLGEGEALPVVASSLLHRYSHNVGYHFFRKRTHVAREEHIFSHFAAACGFPYAPYLPDSGISELYTPKLGNNVTSIYGLTIGKLKNRDPSAPFRLQESYDRALKEFGSPDKIPYGNLLEASTFSGLMGVPEYFEWIRPMFKKESVFLSKLRALASLVETTEGLTNPTNIICNAQTGRFLYAIDMAPETIETVKTGEKEPIIVSDYLDPDIITGMQEIMKEKLTDELIDRTLFPMKVLTLKVTNFSRESIEYVEEQFQKYADFLKYGRDNPRKVIDQRFKPELL